MRKNTVVVRPDAPASIVLDHQGANFLVSKLPRAVEATSQCSMGCQKTALRSGEAQ